MNCSKCCSGGCLLTPVDCIARNHHERRQKMHLPLLPHCSHSQCQRQERAVCKAQWVAWPSLPSAVQWIISCFACFDRHCIFRKSARHSILGLLFSARISLGTRQRYESTQIKRTLAYCEENASALFMFWIRMFRVTDEHDGVNIQIMYGNL